MLSEQINFYETTHPTLEESVEEGSLGVVIVDMQPEFLKDLAPDEKNNLIRLQLALLRYCASEDVPVVLVEARGGLKHLKKTTTLLRRAVRYIRRSERLEKNYPNAFYETNLESCLKSMEVRRILVTGVYASYCVLRTCEGTPQEFGISTTMHLIADPHGDTRNKSSEWYMKNGVYRRENDFIVRNMIARTN